jgi:hypothetical protein
MITLPSTLTTVDLQHGYRPAWLRWLQCPTSMNIELGFGGRSSLRSRMRTQMTVLLSLALLITMTASGCPPGRTSQSPESGVAGVSLVDAGCPTVRENRACPDKPMSAHLTVTPANSTTVVATADTVPDGTFRIPLAPGTYTMTSTNMSGAPMPSSQPISFDVHDHEFTTVTVRFDSGVR